VRTALRVALFPRPSRHPRQAVTNRASGAQISPMPRYLSLSLAISPVALALACTTNHPVTVTPDAVPLTQYLEAHPTSALQVTDTTGHRY